MAVKKSLIILAILALVRSDNEVEAKDKTQKALEEEKDRDHRSRSAVADPVRGSFQKLSVLMNKTENGSKRRKGNMNKILQMNRRHDNMLNDNHGAIAVRQRIFPDNETNAYDKKINELALKAQDISVYVPATVISTPKVTGVFCNFEHQNGSVDMCAWQWNTTVSSHGLGFSVLNAADIADMNETTRGLRFSGPEEDADGNKDGEIRISVVFFAVVSSLA